MSQEAGAAPEVTSDAPAEGQSFEDKAAELVGEESSEELEASEGEEESSEEVEAADEKKEKKKEEKIIKELKKKLKLKVDGKEIEEELDFENDEQLTKVMQEAKAFQKRSQELASLRKQVEGLVSKLQENPMQLLQEMGLDIDDLSKAHLQKRIEEMNKSPEQLEQEAMRKELEEVRRERDAQKKQAEEAQMEQLRNHFAAEIEADINGALTSGTTTLPKSPLVVKRIAETMSLALQRGFTDVKAKDVIPIVEEQFKNELKQMFGNLPEDVIEMLVGTDNIDRVRKKKIAASKKRLATKTAKQVTSETGKTSDGVKEKEVEKVGYRDFFGF